MFNKQIKKRVGVVVLVTQLFSVLTPILTFAAPQSAQATDIQNSLETVGTKANRLKTVGTSGVDESTGAFTYSYPFALPKGLSGTEPSIVLSYNSQTTENSMIGFGWNMAIPYIERTAKYGVDKIYSKNDFVSSLGGELILKTGTTNQYVQKIDDGSYQLYTLSNNIWTLTDRSGNTYTFGTTLDSRLSDETGAKIQKYYLTEVRDILGNKVKYFYEKKNGFVYPKEIVYTIKKDGTYSNKITFEREDRADKDISYKPGFRVEMSDRIKAIRAFTDNVEVAKLELTYVTGQNGTRSLLSTVKESRVGTDNVWSSIPETKFEYEKTNISSRDANISIQSGQIYLDITGDAKPEYFSTTNGTQTYAPWKILDVNGDYFPDIYFHLEKQTYCNGYCGSYWLPADGILKMGIGDGNFTSFTFSKISELNLPVTSNYHWFSRGVDNNIQIMDLNADGLTDLANSNAMFLNNGGVFSNASSSIGSYDNLFDVNGDGLPDKIYKKAVFLNNGNGWNTASDTKYIVPFDNEIVLNGRNFDAGVRFIDVNADGLVDIVRSYTAKYFYGWGGGTGTSAANDVYLNNGIEWVKTLNLQVNGYMVDSYLYYNPTGPEQLTVTYKDIAEINADGSYVIKKQDILKTVVSPLGSKSEVTYKGSVNQNNPKLPINILTVSEIKNTETNKNLVESVRYTYEKGKMYYDKNNIYDRRFAGFQKVTTESGTTSSYKRTVKYFHQGDGDDAATFERGDSFHNIGRVYKEEVYGVVNNVATKYAETYRTYGVYNWDGQVYKYPKLEVATEYDKQGNSFSKATQYDYDLASRLPKKTESFGEVKWDIITGTFQDVGEDYVLTKNIYNTKRPQKLLSEESSDINGKFLDKKIYFYDELPFGYVEKGLLSEERNYSNANNYVKTTYIYNANGLVDTKTDNNGATTKFAYDNNFNPTTITNGLNQTVTSVYHKPTGLKVTETNQNGKVVNTVYDGFGNVKSIAGTSPSDGSTKLLATKNIAYSQNGMTETESVYAGGAVYKSSTKIYDSFGRLIKSQSTGTDNSNQTIDVTFNNLGQMTLVSYPYDGNGLLGSYFAGYDTKYVYDELGRNISVSQGDLTNFTDYILNGKVTRDNTADTHRKEYRYNSLGKLSSVREYTSSSSFTETKYEWNLLGNLTKLTDALGNVRNFQYDTEGRLLKQEDLHSATDNTFGTYTYTYDQNGLLTSKTDPSENVATYEYDILNRPKKESFGVVTNYTYDTCQNGVGALCEVANADYTQKISYNKVGNILTETKTIDDKIFTNTYAYNDLGQNTAITLPDNSVIAYTYDVNGKQKTALLTRTVGGVASTTVIVSDAKFNIDGTIKSITQGNNIKTCYEYSGVNGGNVLPRLSKISVVNGQDCNSTNLLFAQDLKYNLFGSIIENKETIGANNFNNGVQSEALNKYTYDVLQRLVKSERLVGNINEVNNLTYNSIGNILSSDSIQYTYDGSDYKNPHAPSIVGNTVMTYDLNGNVLSDSKNQYEWNVKNTLKKVGNEKSVTEYTYDVNGERIKEVAKVKSTNSTSTFALNEEIENSVGSTTSQTLIKDLPFISENSYNELKTNKLNSQNKIEMLFALAIDGNKYVKDTCKLPANITDANCQKKEAIKFVASYLYTKHNIKLSANTLEEMYGVYIGNLKISKSADVYAKKELGIIASGNRSCNIYQSEPNCIIIINLSTTTGKNYQSGFRYSINAWFGTFSPVDIVVNNEKVISSKLVTAQENISIDNYIKKAADTNNLSNFKIEIRGIFTNWSGMFANGTLEVKEFVYINKNINQNNNVLITDTDLNTKVYSDVSVTSTDKNLLGVIYKQKKIASLFGSEKLISKETFGELLGLGMTYSDVIIKDMLIDYSFAPYTSCDEYYFDYVKRNCRKEIFVKHLFAIVKYETDKEMSAEALDELFEVTEGNLAIPNNIDEYNVYEIKSIASPNYLDQTLIFTAQYSQGFGTVGSCGIGNYSGTWYGSGMTAYSACKPAFSLPQEVKDKAKNLHKVEIEGLNIPKTLTDLTIYLNMGVPNSTNYNDIFNFGVSNSYRAGPMNYQENSSATVDITSVIKPWAEGTVSGDGIRFTSAVGVSTVTNSPSSYDQLGYQVTGISTLKYTFRYDAPQNDRKYLTPLVINPKDDTVYADVLRVLARIDKEYKTGGNTIISGATYSEIKNMDIASSTVLLNIFDQNEKLQKDDTLAAVWDAQKTKYNQELTREALEELYMVWKGQLATPIDNDQYNWSAATTTKVLASVGTSTVKSYLKIVSTTNVTEGGVNYMNISVEPTFTVFNRNTLTNLSVVPGVFSLRSLADNDIINTKMYVATSSKDILKTAGIEKRSDILQFTSTLPGFTSTSTISRVNKIDYLTKINSEIVRIKNVKLSRESLEEIYYILNNKLIVNPLDNMTLGAQELDGLVSKYEMNGVVGSVDKKKDTLRPDKPIYIESNITSASDRKNTGNNAYQFSGSYLKYPAIVPRFSNQARTVSFWMKANSGLTQSIYSFASNDGTRNFFSIWYNNGKIVGEVAWTEGTTNVGFEPVSVKAVGDNVWHKIDVVVQNNPNANIKIYIDGVLDKEETLTKPYNMSGIYDESTIGAFQNYTGGGVAHPYSGALDEVKVYSRALSATEIQTSFNNDIGNFVVPVPENLPIFDKANFGILEPIDGVVSENEKKETDNITYNINSTEIKNISKETVGELSLVGVTTKQQIVDVFNLTKTVDKDSKISFFKEYFEIQKQYSFSREALEEAYLVYIDKAVFVANLDIKISTTTDIYLPTNSNWIVVNLPSNQSQPTNCEAGVTSTGSTNAFGQDFSSCTIILKIPKKDGYKVTNAILNYTYSNSNIDVYLNNSLSSQNASGGSINLTSALDTNNQVTIKITGKYLPYFTTYTNPISNLKVNSTYEIMSGTNDRDNYGELSQVSTEQKLDTSYSTEINSVTFNTGTTSTSTVVRVTSPTAFTEMTSIGATTSAQVKALFASAPIEFGKDAKLYFVYKWAKDNKNVTLTRLTLEEMWNINIDRQLAKLGDLTISTTTLSVPAPIQSAAYYKMDGTLGSTVKKQDEVLTSRQIIENVASVGTGRKNDTNGGYSLPGSGVNKLVATTPTIITNNAMTYSVWVKTTNGSPYQRVISMNTDASRTFIDLDIYQSKPYLEIGNAGVVNREGWGNSTLSNNTWYKLDYVISNSPNATLKLYINGILDQTLVGTAPYNMAGLDNRINLGCYGTGNNCVSPVPGTFDDFKIYTRELTPTEILKEYQIDTGTLPPVVSTTTIVSTDVFNRDRYKELELISPISSLKYAYDVQTGTIILPPVDESIKNTPSPETTTPLVATLDTPAASADAPASQAINISPETLSLLNPLNYPYTVTSETSIDLQINGVTYNVNLTNYAEFYLNLENNNLNTLAKYLNKVNNLSEEVSYTKYYPSSLYEYDSRGYITINIPFNGKVVATVKYSSSESNTGLVETSYLVNNYLATPVLLTDTTGSTTSVINRNVWGKLVNNEISSNKQIPTDIGYTGHKYDAQSELTYAHARYLNSGSKIWLSHDPFSITNFSSDVWLLNPQIQNSYSYASNNPVNMVDPDGKKPTWEEAGAMANDIYDPGNRGANLNGWVLNNIITGGDNMRMGVYSKTVNGKLEYALVNKGTQTFGDWLNNFQQPAGMSDDATAAILLSEMFVKDHQGIEITAVGHSKGGAEAQLIAVKNNINAMVFNSAFPNFYSNDLYEEFLKYDKSKIEQRVVMGELLDSTLGLVFSYRTGSTEYLPFTDLRRPQVPNNFGVTVRSTTPIVGGSLSPITIFQNSRDNHLMGTVNLVNKNK